MACTLQKEEFPDTKNVIMREEFLLGLLLHVCPSRACFETSFNKNLLSRSMFHFSLSHSFNSHIPKESIKTPSLMMILDLIIIKFCFHLQIRSASIKNLFMRFFSFFYVFLNIKRREITRGFFQEQQQQLEGSLI